MGKLINVLVVDDSALMRKLISDILSSDSEIKVVGTAINGKFAVQKTKELGPDVIIMDIEMPEMDGISATKHIMKEGPTPILMLSALTTEGSKYTLSALQAGAVDFILKPSAHDPLDISRIREEIISKIKAISDANLKQFKPTKIGHYSFNPTTKKILLIGASTGGPQTLEALLQEFPDNIPVPIVIVQHMPPNFTKFLAERLNTVCDIEVKEAKEGDKLENGVALIAPGGFHAELAMAEDGSDISISLNKDPPELGVRPSINRLFCSAAKIFKDNTIGIILTGMGSDGTQGAKFIKKENGTIIAEAEESCVIFGMPKEVIKAGYADAVVSLEKMTVALLQILDL